MKNKKFHFCTHYISIIILLFAGGMGLTAFNTERVRTEPVMHVLLIICEICIVLYMIYIYVTFALTVDEKGIRLSKAQDVNRIDWDQVAHITIREDVSTKRVMLHVVPKDFIREKKISFFRKQVTETMDTDVSRKYIPAIQTYYKGEILGLSRLEKKKKDKKEA